MILETTDVNASAAASQIVFSALVIVYSPMDHCLSEISLILLLI